MGAMGDMGAATTVPARRTPTRPKRSMARGPNHRPAVMAARNTDSAAATRTAANTSADISARRAEIRMDGPLPQVLGNELMLRQALTNLIANALKFTEPGVAPRIRIAAEERHTRGVDRVQVLSSVELM